MQAAPQVYLAQDLPPGWVVAAFSLFVKSMSGRRPGRDFRFQR